MILADLRDRIRQKLAEQKLSASKASMRAGLGRTFVRDILNGSVQSPRVGSIVALAPVLGTSALWLMEGRGEHDAPQIPVQYYVGAGASVMPFEDQAPLEYVEIPPGATSVRAAAIVRGTSQLPVFRDGDVVFWGEPTSDPTACYGLECVCMLADDRVLIKTLLPGSKRGRYTLSSYNEEPIFDVEVTAAAPVLFIRRSQARR